MFRQWFRFVTSLLLLAIAVAGVVSQDAVQIHVPAAYPTISAAIASAPAGADIIVGEGKYNEALLIDRPLTLRPADEAEVVLSAADQSPAIQIIGAENVMISGLTIIGGRYGIDVFLSEDVVIADNDISGSKTAGIRARMSSVFIRDNTISNIQPPYGRGIYLANTMAWPQSAITGNTVRDIPLTGIQTNLAGMVQIENNFVTNSGLRGIAVTEMSHANVLGNIVADNIGSGILVLDMSMALVCDNSVSATGEDSERQNMREGNGVTVDFHSEVILSENTIQGSAQNGISVLYGSSAWLHDNVVSDSADDSVFVNNSETHLGRACASPQGA